MKIKKIFEILHFLETFASQKYLSWRPRGETESMAILCVTLRQSPTAFSGAQKYVLCRIAMVLTTWTNFHNRRGCGKKSTHNNGELGTLKLKAGGGWGLMKIPHQMAGGMRSGGPKFMGHAGGATIYFSRSIDSTWLDRQRWKTLYFKVGGTSRKRARKP